MDARSNRPQLARPAFSHSPSAGRNNASSASRSTLRNSAIPHGWSQDHRRRQPQQSCSYARLSEKEKALAAEVGTLAGGVQIGTEPDRIAAQPHAC